MAPTRCSRPSVPALLGLLLLTSACDARANEDAGVEAAATGGGPTFTIEPSWPLQMPNDWIIGSVTGVFVDRQDHVWVTHLIETLTEEEIAAVQEPPIATCCRPAPSVIEFDAQGNV